MRVLHIEAGRHLYGGAAQVRCLVDGLAAAGVDNVLLCARGGALAAQAVAGRVVPIAMHGDLDLGLAPRIVHAIRAARPDVVHVHSRRGAELFGGIAAALAGVPAVLTRRVEAAEPRWLARRKYGLYSAVVALSGAIERELAAAGVPGSRVLRIPSAVDTARLRPDPGVRGRVLAELGLPRDAVVVGVVAQLIERKGHRLLLDALPALVRAEPRVRVLCFGQGPLQKPLADEIERRGLADVVTLAGFRSDLAALMPGFDLLVHPAAREGLGLALVEAAACAVPAVACAAGGVPDVVDDGVTGVLVPAADVAALGDAMARLAADASLRARLGAAARARAERRFGVGGLVAAHLSLYSRVLGERAAHVPVSH
jgi:glycosyltransferase involved in cell wall biosynthesis